MRGANKISTDDHKSPPASPASSRAPRAAEAIWKRVCETTAVPAQGLKEFAVDGINVLIANTADGFVAYQALCPHEAVPLEQGVQDGSVLTCLEHLWQFDLRTGAPMGDAEVGLTGYPLKEEGGDLYIELKG